VPAAHRIFMRLYHDNQQRGVAALIIVIMVTAVAITFGISLAMMNLDYSLSVGASLLNQRLQSAVDACTDSAIGELKRNENISTLNVNDIGPALIDCQATITTNSNNRIVTARATTTDAYFTATRASRANVNIATSPYTVEQYQDDADVAVNVFSSIGTMDLTSSATVSHLAIAVAGNYAYVGYRDTNYSSKLSIGKVNLSTFAVESTLTSVTSGEVKYMDMMVHKNYLYISYSVLSGATEYAGVSRIDLNNFAADGISAIENPLDETIYSYATSITALGDYVYLAFAAAANSNRLTVWKVDTNNFSSAGITARENISAGNCLYTDAATYKNNLIVSCSESSLADKTSLVRWEVANNFSASAVTELAVSSGSADYGSLVILDNYAYVTYGLDSDGQSVYLGRVNLDSFAVEATLDTALDNAWFTDTVTDGRYVYVIYYNDTSDLQVLRVDTRDFQLAASLANLITVDTGYRTHAVIVGKYLYLSHVTATPKNGIVKIQIY